MHRDAIRSRSNVTRRGTAALHALMHDPPRCIRAVRIGLAARQLTALAAAMNRSPAQLIALLGFPARATLHKVRTNGRLSTAQSERVLALIRLVDEVEQMVCRAGDATGFDAAQWVAAWLEGPNPALGGAAPATYLDTYEGYRLLSRLLAQMETGVFV